MEAEALRIGPVLVLLPLSVYFPLSLAPGPLPQSGGMLKQVGPCGLLA